jgi:hypothetical protein
MDLDRAQTLAAAVGRLGSPNDQEALAAARTVAAVIEAEGWKPGPLAAALLVTLIKMPQPRELDGFARLGPQGTRKRLVRLSRARGITPEDKERLTEMRDRLGDDPRAPFSNDEIDWLDVRWKALVADEAARARPAG